MSPQTEVELAWIDDLITANNQLITASIKLNELITRIPKSEFFKTVKHPFFRIMRDTPKFPLSEMEMSKIELSQIREEIIRDDKE